jgi:hypothetical protein
VLGFWALVLLCASAHEFTHHFVGAAVCGGWGQKTFGTFTLADGCGDNPLRFWATAAGPLFTFALLWVGWFLLTRQEAAKRWFGFTLIFANVPINRMLIALLGHNDEQWMARQMYPDSKLAFWIVILIVWGCCLPPLIAAWRAIENGRRWQWFAGFYILPFALLPLSGAFLENYLLLKEHVLATTVIGAPYLVLVVNAICLALLYVFRRSLYGDFGEVDSSQENVAISPAEAN